MKVHPRLLTISLAFIFFTLVTPSSAFSQTVLGGGSTQTMRTEDIRPYGDAAQLEQFRQELLAYFDDWQQVMELFDTVPAVHRQFERSGLRPLATIASMKTHISDLNLRELDVMQKVYSKNPSWRRSPQTINSLIKPALRASLQQRVAALRNGIRPAIADNCQDGINADITNTDISISGAALIAVEAIMEAFPTDGLTIAARLPSIAANALAEGALLTLETLKGIKDDCNGDTFESDIKQLVTDSKNEVINNDNSNRNTIVNNDNSNRQTIVNNDNANLATILASLSNVKTELRDLILRTQIEADLAEADSASPVALYEIPNLKGGYLDLVQTIVTQTLANVVAAGGTISNAQTFLDKGNVDKAAGRFKSAYDNYRKAYKAAAK